MYGTEKHVLLRHYLEQGMSKAAIARELGVERRTIYRWIEAGELDRDGSEDPVRYRARAPKPTKLDLYKGIIRARLKLYPRLTAIRLFDEIGAAGYQGGYTQLWGKRHAFLVVLGFSRVLWLQFFTRQTMQDVFEGLETAFTYFGGVPRELLFDQMKAVIIKDERNDGGRLSENAEFLRFASHHDFRIRACRPYRAKTKGKVERPVSYVRSNFFYGRTFTSDDDLNHQARHWLDHVANVRTHGTLKERPVDRFEHERDVLKPLASRPYRSFVLPPEAKKRAKAALPRIEVQRRPLEAYAELAGGGR